MIKMLLEEYDRKKQAIKRRLREFRSVWGKDEHRIFSELCFCICTPQSRAVYCDKAITSLSESGLLFSGDALQISGALKAVRFPNNKASYIVHSRRLLTDDGKISLKKHIDPSDIKATREWLQKNVKGLGLKEASHFLRNIGFGRDLAILDVHIIKNMLRYRMIEQSPRSISRKVYMELEEGLRRFSGRTGIPMDELDLLFWSSETGEIFK